MNRSLNKALSRIKKEHLSPIARGEIVFRRSLRWVLAALALFLGALSLAAALQLSWEMDWDGRALAMAGAGGFLKMIPYFWILVLATLFALLLGGVRRTENGYRLGRGALWGAALLSLGAVGLVWAALDGGRAAHQAMLRSFPAYGDIAYTKEKQWSQPEKGLLAGTIKQVRSRRAIVVDDLGGKRWEVGISENTLLRPMVKLEQGEKVKMIGAVSGENSFGASEIRPWEGRGMRQRNGEDFQRGQGAGRGRMQGR
ncbi:MAG TPA: hypothetical protein PKA31_01400 [Candidatus Moranbacteria bacterium]|nr:hypothetical protein [Candidatus Moranbacteria bacterium]